MSCFEAAIRDLGKRRITLSEMRDAFLHAHPETQNAPDLRQLLLAAMRRLETAGILSLPAQRTWDRSTAPSLPRSASLNTVPATPPGEMPYAWLPELAFASSERHPVRREHLKAINTFLLSRRGTTLSRVPTNERSLHIFGDEKQLDTLRKGDTTLFNGRLSLDDLGCYAVTPPLAFEAIGERESGRPILVLENHHSYESFRRWNRQAATWAAIAYGGGNAFRKSVGHLDDLIIQTGACAVFYLGDLDPAGIAILLGVRAQRPMTGAIAIAPHLGLYRWLLAHGHRRPLDAPTRPAAASDIATAFPPDLVEAFGSLWSENQRIPQESFGLEQLAGTDAAIAGPMAACR